MPLRDAIQHWDRPVILYEVIPPLESADDERVDETAHRVRDLIDDRPVDAINIPEVREESRNGDRPASRFKPRRDPRAFGVAVRDALADGTDILVNHPSVHAPGPAFRTWLDATLDEHEIPNIVLVGGESHDIDYPGPGPVDAARIARDHRGDEPLLGGITIPTRRREGDRDEPARLVAKADAGIDFFTSQVVYEPASTKRLLHDYAAACAIQRKEPRPIFLSFAPVTARKDANFLRWLGVEFPKSTEEWILDANGDAADRSTRVAENVLREILDYVARRNLPVPIGLNVEHVMHYNLDAAARLLDRLVDVAATPALGATTT